MRLLDIRHSPLGRGTIVTSLMPLLPTRQCLANQVVMRMAKLVPGDHASRDYAFEHWPRSTTSFGLAQCLRELGPRFRRLFTPSPSVTCLAT